MIDAWRGTRTAGQEAVDDRVANVEQRPARGGGSAIAGPLDMASVQWSRVVLRPGDAAPKDKASPMRSRTTQPSRRTVASPTTIAGSIAPPPPRTVRPRRVTVPAKRTTPRTARTTSSSSTASAAVAAAWVRPAWAPVTTTCSSVASVAGAAMTTPYQVPSAPAAPSRTGCAAVPRARRVPCTTSSVRSGSRPLMVLSAGQARTIVPGSRVSVTPGGTTTSPSSRYGPAAAVQV